MSTFLNTTHYIKRSSYKQTAVPEETRSLKVTQFITFQLLSPTPPSFLNVTAGGEPAITSSLWEHPMNLLPDIDLSKGFWAPRKNI